MNWLTKGIATLAVLALAAGCADPARMQGDPALPGGHPAGGAAADFARVKGSPVELRMFLQRFPKGGDLHSHLSGAVYAEDFIDWSLESGACIDLEGMTATAPPCDPAAGRPAMADALAAGQTSRDAVIDAWSMRNFVPGISAPSGHAQFFGTFFRFGAAGDGRRPGMLVEAVAHAAEQRIGYLELMTSPQMGEARALAADLAPSDGDWDRLTAELMTAGIQSLVPRASAELDAMEAELRRRFACPGSGHPACEVEVRYLAQVIRTFPPDQVFAQSLFAFLLVQADPRVVGLNLVAPEDDHVTLSTYETQMRQLGWLADHLGPVPVTLHAGELRLGLVHPRHLRSHIRQAIELAGATRIGHGVSIAHERDAEQLLRHMAAEGIAVEINLTSNAQILGVEGAEHPFPTYRAYGIPVTLSTDDEGVSRIDLTHEYQRAIQTYDLDYDDIRALSRNALTYAFVEGESLWADPAGFRPVAACATAMPGRSAPDQACSAFLAENRKAALQWRLEQELAAFDSERAGLAHRDR